MIKPMNNVISMDKVIEYVSKDKTFKDKYIKYTPENFSKFQYEMICLGHYHSIAITKFIQNILDNCFIKSEWEQLKLLREEGYISTIHLYSDELSFDLPYGNTMRNFVPLDLSFTIAPDDRFDSNGNLIEKQRIWFMFAPSSSFSPQPVIGQGDELSDFNIQRLLTAMSIKKFVWILADPYNTAKLIKEFIAALNKCIASSLKQRGLYMLTNENCEKHDEDINQNVADYCWFHDLLFKLSAAFDTHLEMTIKGDNMAAFIQKTWETQLRFDNSTFLKTRGGEKMKFVDGSERCEYCDCI